jgi:hypothetical protein
VHMAQVANVLKLFSYLENGPNKSERLSLSGLLYRLCGKVRGYPRMDPLSLSLSKNTATNRV